MKKNLKLLVCSSLVILTFSASQKIQGTEDYVKQSATNGRLSVTLKHEDKAGTKSSSLFSSFTNAANKTLSWINECALNECDRFAKWIGSYAREIPPAYFAKSFLEIDYARDALFWQGHFNQHLSDLKKARFLGLQEKETLKEIQDLVWNGLLSPYTYEVGMRELEKKKPFSQGQNARNLFCLRLKENPVLILTYLQKDLENSIKYMQNSRDASSPVLMADFKEKLAYYRSIVNAFDFAETLASFLEKMRKPGVGINIQSKQYKIFNNLLIREFQKIDWREYYRHKVKHDSRLSFPLEQRNIKLRLQLEIEEEHQYLKAAIMGWLILTGDVFSSLLTIPDAKKNLSLKTIKNTDNSMNLDFSCLSDYGAAALIVGATICSNKDLTSLTFPLFTPFLFLGVSARTEVNDHCLNDYCLPGESRPQPRTINPISEVDEILNQDTITNQLIASYKDHYTWEHHPNFKNPSQGFSHRMYKVPLGSPIAVQGHLFQPTFESRDPRKVPHKFREIIPRQWIHHDDHKYSYAAGEIYIWDNQMKNEEKIEDEIPIGQAHHYIEKDDYEPYSSIKLVNVDECLKPRLEFRRKWFYERPDKTSYNERYDSPQEFEINRMKHQAFKTLGDYSYQVLKIAIQTTVMGYKEIYESFELDQIKYPHKKKYTLLINNDKDRMCTYHVETYVTPEPGHCSFHGTRDRKFTIKEEEIKREYEYTREVSCTFCLSHTYKYSRCSEIFGYYNEEVDYYTKLPDKKIIPQSN